ncbi:MAG: 3-dehydroquinate synthase, partial [Rivularia sp. (in: cyanobacteria)]
MILDLKRKTKYKLQPIQQRVEVTFNYSVHFTNGIFNLDNPLLARVVADDGEAKPKKVVFVVDSGLLEYQQGLLEQLQEYCDRHSDILISAPPLVVPGGEAAKNDPRLPEKIHQLVDNAGICRHSYLIAVGGGAVLDLVGYAAATAHRGIRLIRIPTTVLAQNDSAVGVKNGINAFGKKNFLGSFAPPYAVLNDFDFLSSLDERDWRSGIAEAVKVALIRDADFFEFIENNAALLARRDLEAMQQVIYRCAQLHLKHISTSGDAFEMGSSRPLDFGHWAAHKLEQLTNYRLRHGEAVAIGIALDSTYSYIEGMLPHSDWQKILNTLKTLGFELHVPELTEESEIEHPR